MIYFLYQCTDETLLLWLCAFSSMSIQEICENTKMGREQALLGNYETSQVYYQGVLQQIQKLLLTIKDTTRKQKWQQVGHVCLVLAIWTQLVYQGCFGQK